MTNLHSFKYDLIIFIGICNRHQLFMQPIYLRLNSSVQQNYSLLNQLSQF